jgi:RNA polymerase sigma-70 factor, ECF subfamily
MEQFNEVEATSIHLAQQGNVKAFGDLYNHYADRVYRYLAFRLRNDDEAEDLTAETFIKALQAINKYRSGQVPFGAWLFRIAHNVLVDHWRHTARKQSVELDDAAAIASDSYANAFAQVLSRADLEQGLAQLTELQRQTITLRFVAGCSLAETAQTMHRSEEAVKDLQHKALVAMRKCLDRP